MNNAVYDFCRIESLSSENEVFANDNERGGKSPINQESVEYASDSSCEDYRFQRQQVKRRNSSPIVAASSTFTIDSILGRNEKKSHIIKTNNPGDKKEDQDEGDEMRIETHFVRPTAIPAARSGMRIYILLLEKHFKNISKPKNIVLVKIILK